MLREINGVRQIIGEPFRRWFRDSYFDLMVWYEENLIVGFQLCYDIYGYQRAVTFLKDRITHLAVDEGEGTATSNRTPILVQDGNLDSSKLIRKFISESENIDKYIVKFVLAKLSTCI